MSAINIASNLLFQWLLLVMLGPGVLTDALFASMTLPQLFTAIVAASLTHVLVPLLAGEPHDEQSRDAWTFFAYSTLLFATLSSALIFTAVWWVPLMVPGFSAEARQTTVELARINLLGMAFTGMTAVQAAIGFARQKYIWTDAAPMFANLAAVILLVWLLPDNGVWAAAWISVLRLLVQTTLLLPLMGKPSMPNRNSPMIKITWYRIRPILLGASYYKMDPLLDRFLLSAGPIGSLSLLYLVQQLYSAASQVVVKAIAVPALTQLAAAHKQNDRLKFSTKLTRTLLTIGAVCTVGILILWMQGEALLKWGLENGKFSSTNAHELWVLLMLSAGMLAGGAMGSFAAGAFYAKGDTRTPTWVGSISFTIAIFIKLIMFRLYGVQGLAIAISLYYLNSLCIQWFILSRGLED